MTYWVLKAIGRIVPRRSMQRLTPEEMAREEKVKERQRFNLAIERKYGSTIALPKRRSKDEREMPIMPNPSRPDGSSDLESYEVEDVLEDDEILPNPPEADIVDANGIRISPVSMGDLLVNAEVLFPGEEGK